MRQLFRELKRRNVYRVAATYAAAAFVTLQAARLIFPATTLEGLYDKLVVLAFVGFPIALVIAWAFELTPEGVRRTREVERRTPAAEEPGDGRPVAEGEPPVERRSGSRLALSALVGLGLVAAAVAGTWYLTGGGGDAPETSEHTVAVLPFQVSGSGAEAWRDGMVTMLSTGLDGAGGLRAIADQTVLAAWEGTGGTAGPEKGGRSLATARQVGARYAVVGQAVELSGDLRLAADVHDARTGDRLGQVEVAGSSDRVTALADSLTRAVLGVLLEAWEEDFASVDLATLTTSSRRALKAYLRGERHFRSAAYGAAIEDYETAVADDSAFALAHARLARSHGWLHELEAGQRHWRRAFSLADRLPERERRLVRAQHLWNVRSRSVAAADSLRRLAGDYPDDPSVWYELGEVLFHRPVPGGWPEADEAFGRAVDLDPGMTPYHHHYVDLALAVHHDSVLAAERLAAHPGSGRLKRAVRSNWHLAFGSPERRRKLLAGPDTVPVTPWGLLHPAEAETYLRLMESRPDVGILPRTGALLARGRVREAVGRIRDRALPPAIRACVLAQAASLETPIPDSVARRHLDPSSLPDDASPRRLACVGLHLVDRGRGDELPGLIDRIRSSSDSLLDRDPAATSVESLVEELEGYRAFRAGNLERAARLWSGSNVSWYWGAIWRGDLFRRLGELERAEGWYLAAWPHPVAHERLGRFYEEMDRPDEAAAAYRRFVAAWEEADEALQPRVEAARERVRRLTGSVGEAGG